MFDILAENLAGVGKREGKRDAQLGAFLAAASKIVLAKSRELDRLRAENERLRAALTIARTALLNIERRSEEGRAAMTRMLDEQEPPHSTSRV